MYSNGGIGLVLAAPVVGCLIVLHQRARAFYYVTFIGCTLLIMNVTKLYYHQARPYWASEDVQAFSCSSQYGNPSGHSLFSMATALVIWLDYNQHAQEHQGIWFSKGARVFFLIVALVFGATIGYSRMFLGVHSLNQLIFGWSFGIWLALTLHFIFKDKVIENARQLLRGDEQRFLEMALRCGLVMFCAFAMEIVNYATINDDIVNGQAAE